MFIIITIVIIIIIISIIIIIIIITIKIVPSHLHDNYKLYNYYLSNKV